MIRYSIFVDGANLYRSLKAFDAGRLGFNFKEFVDAFVENGVIAERRYYLGEVVQSDDKSSDRLFSKQQLLFSKLKKSGFKIVKGNLIRVGKSYVEKGVDVSIAVDMLSGAYEDSYDRSILISSDGDLAPVIEKIRSLSKEVDVIGFPGRVSYSLKQVANRYRIVKKEKVMEYLHAI